MTGRRAPTRWAPCRRRDFVRKLRRLGFEGPFPARRHQVMYLEGRRFTVPNNREFSVPQVKALLGEVALLLGRDIELEEWSNL
jgi:hypothetical protein